MELQNVIFISIFSQNVIKIWESGNIPTAWCCLHRGEYLKSWTEKLENSPGMFLNFPGKSVELCSFLHILRLVSVSQREPAAGVAMAMAVLHLGSPHADEPSAEETQPGPVRSAGRWVAQRERESVLLPGSSANILTVIVHLSAPTQADQIFKSDFGLNFD